MDALLVLRKVGSLWRFVRTGVRPRLARGGVRAIRWAYHLLGWLTGGSIPPIVGAACLVRRNGKILAIDRSDGLGLALPGGVVRSDESVEGALVREVKEETGLEVHIGDLIGVYSGPDRDPRFSSVSVVYTAEIVDGTEQGSKEGAVCWLSLHSLPGQMAFDHLAVVCDYVQNVAKKSPDMGVDAKASAGCRAGRLQGSRLGDV